MKTFVEYKTFVAGLFDTVGKFANQTGYEHISKNIERIKKDFLNKELIVVTCGEMRRGKSSLLTAFLEEDQIFPIDINTCTNVVTIVRYGQSERIEVVLEKKVNEEITYESALIKRSEIEQYVTEYGNENNKKKVHCLNIVVPNEKLKEGFVFVDTPGVGSLNFEHSQITYGFLPNTDVMLFVSDVLNPLTDSELKFLEKGFSYCKNILFPLTKSDKKTKKEIEATLVNNKEKICTITKLSPDAVHIIPVSNKMKLRYLDKKQNDDLINSNFQQLEELIWKTIYDNRAQIVIFPFLQQLYEEILKLKSNINIQLEALAQDKEVVNRLANELQEKSIKKQDLLASNAKWKSDLQYELTNISIEIGDEIHSESINISDQVDNWLSIPDAAGKINSIVSEINEMLSGLVYNSRDTISSKTLDIVDDISREIGLTIDINEEAINSVGFTRKQSVDYVKSQRNLADNVIHQGRKIGMSSMGGAAIGTVLGTIFGGFIGLLGGPAGVLAGAAVGAQWGAGIGTIGGTAKGTVDVIKNKNEEDIPAIKKALSNYISKSINSIRSGVNLCIREIIKDLTQELSNQIHDQIQQLDTNAIQIKNNLALKQADIPKRAETLTRQMIMVKGFEKSAAQLKEEISK